MAAMPDSLTLEDARRLITKYMHPSRLGRVPNEELRTSIMTTDVMLAWTAAKAREDEGSHAGPSAETLEAVLGTRAAPEPRLRYRFESVVATGDSPDALEEDAIAQAAIMLSRPAEVLGARLGYLVHVIPPPGRVLADGDPAAEARRKAKPGHSLWAIIAVGELAEFPPPPSRGQWLGQADDEGWVPQ